jgi:hypothetical protein
MSEKNAALIALGAIGALAVASEVSKRQRAGSQALSLDQILAMAEKTKKAYPERASGRGDKSKYSLTVLSNGLGRDSATMISLLVEGKLRAGGELILPKDVDLVVFSDTGYEWSFTYQVIPHLEKMLDKVGVPFFILWKPPEEKWRPYTENKRNAFLKAWDFVGGRTLNADDGIFKRHGRLDRYRSKLLMNAPPWLKEDFDSLMDKAKSGAYHRRAPILEQYELYSRITTRSSPECTDAHKIQPIERLVADMLSLKYDMPWTTRKDVPSVKASIETGKIGKVRMLIGFAADEMGRVSRGKEAVKGAGKTGWKEELYPLVDMGISKADEIPILKRHGLNWIRKSGCMICHWQTEGWFWALSVSNPELFKRIEEYEAEALVRNPRMFIRGKKPIGEMVREWRAKNPDAKIDDVLDKSYERACKFGSKNGRNLWIPV